MAKKQLKKRIFVPTGNDLGEFTIFDLQPVDVTFVDSDDNSQQSSGDSKMGGSNSSIPDPVDNNPLSKGNSSNGSQGSSGGKDANPYANNSSDNNSSDEFSKQDRDLDNDLYGEDLDTDREEQSNNNNSDGEGGSSGDDGSGESGGSSGGMASEDNSYAPPNYDGSSNMGDDSSSLNSTSEMEDALNKEQENMSDTAKERASEVSGENSQSSTSQKGDNSNQQSGDKSQNGGQSQSGDSSQQGDNSQSGDDSNSQGGEGSQSQDNQAGSGSRGDKGDKPNDDFKKAHDTKGNDLDDTDGKGVVDKIVREAAKRMQEELDKDETLANTNQQSLDNYKDFGAGTMTTLFKGNSMVADWKAKLEKLFRKALGQRITMNPNMINKRIEDAPPGREDIETQMIKVAVLIDCSGSMGSGAFKKVIMQMDAMIKADKQMRNVLFYIIPFEAWSAAECVKRMVKCKGTKLKAELMKFKAEGGTDIVPGVHAMMKKVKNPDSIIILSDCGVNASRTVSDTTYQKWLKKYRDRIIWVLTSKRDIQMMNAIDSYAKKQDRYVVFKGNGD